MLSVSFRLRSLFLPAIVASLFAASATGCGGCDADNAQCDAEGNNCQICDAYGCHQADQTVSAAVTVGSGGASSTAVTSTGGSSSVGGQGGAGTGGSTPVCDPTQATCACDDSGQCSGGLVCANGLCVTGCDFSYQCGAGKVCDNGQCVVGCDDNTPCAVGGEICQNGVCVPDPTNPACSDTKPCDGGGVCVDGVCATPCTTNAQCPSGDVCDGSSGACIVDPSPTQGCSATTPCNGTGQECGSDGYCHYPCTTENDCQLIDSRFVACDSGICKTNEEVNPECSLSNPCPSGQDCISNKCE